jgi:molybdate transport system ATP-binding protein
MLEVDLHGQVGTLEVRAKLVADGHPLVLAGPNGSGKTSLLLMLLGVVRPRSGRVVLAGRTLFDSGGSIDLPPEDRGIGYVPQDYALFPHMTVQENVGFAIGCRDPAMSRRARREEATALLEELDIGRLAPRSPATLSGGERQRVALARALATRPRALLLDEPMGALDAGARRQVRSFLGSYLAKLGLPALVVTHDPADAAALGERIAVLEAGRVVQTADLSELRRRPATPFVAEFVLAALGVDGATR